MGLAELSAVLWRERELLELLHFKLEEEQLLLAAGKAEWIARAAREVEVVLAQIAEAEAVRAGEVQAVGPALGLSATATLAQLGGAVDEPWAAIFRDHRTAFLAATAEITSVASANRALLTAGYRATEQALAAFTSSAGPALSSYTAAGRREPAPAAWRHTLDRAI